ncbi:unnamed protein product, partial [marine sediment metagenome]
YTINIYIVIDGTVLDITVVQTTGLYNSFTYFKHFL